MHFEANNKHLLSALEIVSPCLVDNVVIDACKYVHFYLVGENLSIRATNIESHIKTDVEVFGGKNGQACILGKLLIDILKSKSSNLFKFEIADGNCKLTSTNCKFNIPCIDSDDFIDYPIFEGETTKIDDFKGIIDRASIDSVGDVQDFTELISFQGREVYSTDKSSGTIEKIENSVHLNIFSKERRLFKHFLDGEVEVKIGKRQASFFDGQIEVIVTLPTIKFPSVTTVYPDGFDISTDIYLKEFIEKVKTCALINTFQDHIKLEGVNGKIHLSSRESETNRESLEVIKMASRPIDNIELHFVSKKMIKGLSLMQGEKVELSIINGQKPIQIKDETGFIFYCMPYVPIPN